MRKIPLIMREEMAKLPFYSKCCLEGQIGACEGHIQWHHGFQYAGRQYNAIWAIVPLCVRHHDMAWDHYVKEKIDHILFNRATDEELRAVSKAVPLINARERLNRIYGVPEVK